MSQPETAFTSETHPAELRQMFGRNLRRLCVPYRSVSDLCRQLGINRTQFNRYLSGESFPRPDVLHLICKFFDVDARILLEPLEALDTRPGVLNHPFLAGNIGSGMQTLTEEAFPSGFYRFSRKSFVESDLVVVGLVFVFRDNQYTFLRGYEPRAAMSSHGLPTNGPVREYRGYVSPQEDGISINVSHRHNMAATFGFLGRVAAFQNKFWLGYSARPTRETLRGRRVARMVYEHLDLPLQEIVSLARNTGYVDPDALPNFHKRHLMLDTPFT